MMLAGFNIQGSNRSSGNRQTYPGSKQPDCSVNSLGYVERSSVVQKRELKELNSILGLHFSKMEVRAGAVFHETLKYYVGELIRKPSHTTP